MASQTDRDTHVFPSDVDITLDAVNVPNDMQASGHGSFTGIAFLYIHPAYREHVNSFLFPPPPPKKTITITITIVNPRGFRRVREGKNEGTNEGTKERKRKGKEESEGLHSSKQISSSMLTLKCLGKQTNTISSQSPLGPETAENGAYDKVAQTYPGYHRLYGRKMRITCLAPVDTGAVEELQMHHTHWEQFLRDK